MIFSNSLAPDLVLVSNGWLLGFAPLTILVIILGNINVVLFRHSSLMSFVIPLHIIVWPVITIINNRHKTLSTIALQTQKFNAFDEVIMSIWGFSLAAGCPVAAMRKETCWCHIWATIAGGQLSLCNNSHPSTASLSGFSSTLQLELVNEKLKKKCWQGKSME